MRMWTWSRSRRLRRHRSRRGLWRTQRRWREGPRPCNLRSRQPWQGGKAKRGLSRASRGRRLMMSRLSHPRSLRRRSLLQRRKQLLRRSQQWLQRKCHQERTKWGINESRHLPPHGPPLHHQAQGLHLQGPLRQAPAQVHNPLSHLKILRNARPRKKPRRSGSFLP